MMMTMMMKSGGKSNQLEGAVSLSVFGRRWIKELLVLMTASTTTNRSRRSVL